VTEVEPSTGQAWRAPLPKYRRRRQGRNPHRAKGPLSARNPREAPFGELSRRISKEAHYLSVPLRDQDFVGMIEIASMVDGLVVVFAFDDNAS
jgi:hypothetical protein